LKEVHEANFGRDQLRPVDLLSSLYQYKLENLFPNICVNLRILHKVCILMELLKLKAAYIIQLQN
jgi:hypothetical protein